MRARHLQPAFGHRPLHGHAAAERHDEGGEIELGEVGVVEQRVEERVEAGEDMNVRLLEFLHQPRNVARIGNQHIMGAERHAHQRIHRQCEDVIERQRAEEVQYVRLLLLVEGGFQPELQLHLVGKQVLMRQHRTLGNTCRSTRILQEGNVAAGERDGRKRPVRPRR